MLSKQKIADKYKLIKIPNYKIKIMPIYDI
jgi:hypothetical protein